MVGEGTLLLWRWANKTMIASCSSFRSALPMSGSKWCRDQRLYKASLTSKTCDLQPLTAEDSKLRFADAVVDLKRNRLITVCEDHSKEGEAVNTISSVGQSSGPCQEPTHCLG